jgi:hypothetical protein
VTGADRPPGAGYLLPTPAGALRATTPRPGPDREALRALLRSETTPARSATGFAALDWWGGADRLTRLLTGLIDQGLVEVSPRPYRLGDKKVELVLPTLLQRLSARDRGLLADNEGFLVSSVGYDDEVAVNMAALVAEMVEFDRRWRQRLGPGETGPLPVWWTNWPGADDRLGLFILNIGDVPFVLVVEGELHLRDPAFVWLVWSLSHRYDRVVADAPTQERVRAEVGELRLRGTDSQP